ncbi:DUF4175 family protein [Mucilaginibacter segetis]|uniref:DUF4175 family protein n=1 Tax=Mucilaginibacter segetis TaxID=2793071 RepID=A0A934UL82_9SPHI|nr:DUF4175 family protein [Mucilaginibacter segetis]MBK0377695.1 DUF4175 family protein [Mucilaginibacter segetis]
MADKSALHIIYSLRRRYLIFQVLADVVLAAAIGTLFGGLFINFTPSPVLTGTLGFIAVLSILLAIHKPWLVSNQNICSYLNKKYPELKESAGLLLLPVDELNVLQTLALSHTETTLTQLQIGYGYFTKRLLRSSLLMLLAVFSVLIMAKWYHHKQMNRFTVANTIVKTALPPERVLPQIKGVELTITPPAYTHKTRHMQDRFNFTAEQGATIKWNIKTNIPIKGAFLIFNDKKKVSLANADAGTSWKAEDSINRSGFYQVSIDGKLSDLYQIEVIPDEAPVIHIKTPKQYTYIDAGELQRVNINTNITDDYGVADAWIMATVAKGQGEGVQFKEYRLKFPETFNALKSQYNLQKLIDLPQLSMEPGDELYFYIQAKDTYQQLSRTDVYTVTIQDTSELLSMDGILTGADIKPEFFRSERQIIIDAEKLIKEKDTLNAEKFNKRSNDLATDQKLLRLRYGKFLGEENETMEGAGGSDELSEPENFSNAEKILKAYTDDHDKAEDAQFFEPAVKKQLKATLTEMWKAELQLRLYKPQAALPFAYKALRLLKDLQQKSRSYVAKTSYNPPPLKLEKRLSGELDKITQPVNSRDIKPAEDKFAILKNAVNVLEQLKLSPVLNSDHIKTLHLANQQLSVKASAQPGIYLPALRAMRRILSVSNGIQRKDIDLVERAIQKTLNDPKISPNAEGGSADMGLSTRYYQNLKQNNR